MTLQDVFSKNVCNFCIMSKRHLLYGNHRFQFSLWFYLFNKYYKSKNTEKLAFCLKDPFLLWSSIWQEIHSFCSMSNVSRKFPLVAKNKFFKPKFFGAEDYLHLYSSIQSKSNGYFLEDFFFANCKTWSSFWNQSVPWFSHASIVQTFQFDLQNKLQDISVVKIIIAADNL